MGDVVNLRLQRKRRKKALAEVLARENRAAFGRSKEEKARQALFSRLENKRFEEHRLDRKDKKP